MEDELLWTAVMWLFNIESVWKTLKKDGKIKKDNFFFNTKCDSAPKTMIWPGEIGFMIS